MRIFPGSNDGPCPIRGSLVVLLCLGLATHVPANPSGRAVRAGEIRFQQRGDTLRVIQGTQQGIIDWDSFSIAKGETTRFSQPNAQSATLNRVTGGSLSSIDGRLLANGRVFLLNSNGIVIGRDGVVDVAGFAASTLDVSNESFLAGGDLTFRGGSQAAVVNLGSISAFDGDIFLVAASVDNSGYLRAPRGTVGLAAGNDVLIRESGSERIFVRGANGGKKANGVINQGTVEANVAELKAYGGNVYGMAVKNEGRVAATAVTREGGQIFLRAGGRSPGRPATGGGKVKSTGTLSASRPGGTKGGSVVVDAGPEGEASVGGLVEAGSALGTGGDIIILGDTVEIFEGSLILADGETGGGSIRVGGGLRGKDPELANAESVTVGRGARFSANALGSGDGGLVVAFAEGTLEFRGRLSARGGLLGGKGGFVELSGQRDLYIDSLVDQVDLSAPLGKAGTLLIDPIDIQILPGTGGGGVSGTTIYAEDIAAFLADASLTITTTDPSTGNGDITMATGAAINWSSASSLTLKADRDFIMTAASSIESSGVGSFSATAARSVVLHSGSLIRVNGGDLALSANRQINSTAGNFSGITVNGATVQATGNGAVSLSGRGGTSGDSNLGINILNGGIVSGGTGSNLVLDGTGGDSAGNGNFGVRIAGLGSLVSSLGANVKVTGLGGGSGTGDSLAGVSLEDSLISAGGSGNVLVTGNAATTGTAFSKVGVDVRSGAQITSEGGNVQVDGSGGASSATSQGAGSGVRVIGNGLITAGGSGAVNVNGSGGGGLNSSHEGIHVDGGGFNSSLARIGAGNGVTSLTAIAGNTLSHALSIGAGSGGRVSTGNNNLLNIYTDSLLLGANGILSSGSGLTNLYTRSTGTRIDLGGADILSGSPLTLGLTNLELDRITAGTLRIGNATSGRLQVSSSISYDHHLSLTSGEGALIDAAVTMGADRDFTLTAHGITNGTISFTGANAGLSTSGNGSVSLTTVRDISLLAGSSIVTENGDLTLSANGQGGDVSISGVISSLGGSISIEGHNITVSDTAVTTTGPGAIKLEAARAIFVGMDSAISVVDGSLTLSANAGPVPLDGDFGGIVISDSTLTTSGPGVISLTGVGGSNPVGSTSVVDGIRLIDGAGIHSTGNGTGAGGITLKGTGGTGMLSNAGVFISGADTVISSAAGAISLTGVAGDSVSGGGDGVVIAGGSAILSTGNSPGAATITVTGSGGGFGSDNRGVVIVDQTTLIQSATADIFITGNGGGQNTGEANRGILLSAATIGAAGSGGVELVGIGGLGFSRIDGVQIEYGAGLQVENGALAIEGTAGGGLGFGVFATPTSGDITVSGSGSISITGSGMNVAGVNLSGPVLGGSGAGSLFVESLVNDVIVESDANAAGNVSFFAQRDVVAGGRVMSGNGNVAFAGRDVTINGLVSVLEGDVSVEVGKGFSSPGSGGIAAVNAALVHGGTLSFLGGSGDGDTVSYAGFSGSRVIFEFNHLSGIENLVGTTFTTDRLNGPTLAGTYFFTGRDRFEVSGVTITGFENLFAGPGNDTFLVGPGGGLSGILNGGAGFDVLDYSGFSAPVSVNLGAATATGFGGIAGLESFRGSAFEDSFTGTNGNDTFTINAANAGNINGSTFFASFEHLKGGAGADRFLFLNQATVGSVGGGSGNDLLEIDDRKLGGTNTYTITPNQISRNSSYTFTGMESIKLLLGPGNDTVVTRDIGMTQTFDGGPGNDLLEMGPGVFLSGSPMPLGGSTIFYRGFEGPLAPGSAPGEVLQVQTGNVPRRGQDITFEVEDRFTPDGGAGRGGETLLQALSQQGGNAFSSVLAGQAVVLQLDGQQYLVGVPASLDGSLTAPPADLLARLRENLRAEGWAELAEAIGFYGPMTLVNLDGPFPLDLASPIPPGILVALADGLDMDAAQELFAALEMVVFVPVTAADGAVSLFAVAVPIDESIRALLLEQLSEVAFTELSGALDL